MRQPSRGATNNPRPTDLHFRSSRIISVKIRIKLCVVAVIALGCMVQSSPAKAFDQELHVAGGLGISFADEKDTSGAPGSGLGFFASTEYVLKITSWIYPQVYGGIIVTVPGRKSCGTLIEPCDVSSKAVFAGAKLHIMAPIPYVGPFIGFGVGGTAGRIATRNGPLYDKSRTGVMYHFPIDVGLAIGKNHDFELALSYMYYPGLGHVDSALALGFQIPI